LEGVFYGGTVWSPRALRSISLGLYRETLQQSLPLFIAPISRNEFSLCAEASNLDFSKCDSWRYFLIDVRTFFEQIPNKEAGGQKSLPPTPFLFARLLGGLRPQNFSADGRRDRKYNFLILIINHSRNTTN